MLFLHTTHKFFSLSKASRRFFWVMSTYRMERDVYEANNGILTNYTYHDSSFCVCVMSTFTMERGVYKANNGIFKLQSNRKLH